MKGSGMAAPVTRPCALSIALPLDYSATLRRAGANLHTTINSYWDLSSARFRHILPSDLTRLLRSAIALNPDPAYGVNDVSIRSTRGGGAMALLCGGIDRDRIRLVG